MGPGTGSDAKTRTLSLCKRTLGESGAKIHDSVHFNSIPRSVHRKKSMLILALLTLNENLYGLHFPIL